MIILIITLIFLISIFILVFNNEKLSTESKLIIDKIKRNFSIINENFKNIPISEGTSSYTLGKKSITLCLKNLETQQYYDMNTIMYVSLHELAHIITPRSDNNEHGEKFKNNFTLLLNIAKNKGIWNSNKILPSIYCGVST